MPVTERLKINLAYGFALLMLLAVGILSYRNIQDLRSDQQWILRAEETLRNLEEVHASLKDAQTAQRGYLLTGQERFLAPYYGTAEVMGQELATLRQSIVDRRQREDLARLEALARRRMALTEETIRRARAGDLEGAIAVVRSGAGQELMDDVRTIVRRMQAREFAILQARRDRESETARITVAVVLLASLLAVSVVSMSRQRMVAELAARERAEAALAENEQCIRTLHDIASSPEHDFQQKASQLLELGCSRFGLTLGVLSHIHEGLYEVLAACDSQGEIQAGDVFPLEETYCSAVLERRTIQSWIEAGKTDLSAHPCYSRFGLETYLGTPIVVEGELYGTICFSDRSPRDRPFSEAEKDFLRLMAQWVGGELERRHAEYAVRESEERYRRLSEASMEGVAVTQDGRIVDANRAFAEMFGRPLEEVIGRSPLEFVAPESAAVVDEMMAGGSDDPYEVVGMRRDGSRLLMEVRGRATAFRGRPARVTALQDITARRRVEEVIRESEERYRSLVEAASDVIYRADVAGHFTYVNPKAVEIMEHPEDRLIGMHFTELIREDAREPVLAFYVNQLASRIPTTYNEFPVVTASGREVWLGQNVGLLYQAGEVVGVQAVARDISKRREVEHMKDEFLSVVSHELRTPLTAIRGSLGLLASGKMGTLQERGQRMLEIAAQNTDRLVRLINDLLDFEKITSGKTSMERQEVDAGELMRQAVEVMTPMAEKAGVHLAVQPLATPLWADPDRIMQVLTNLLSNAIKFSPEGGTVWVEAERRDAMVLVSVRDQGRGIPADKLDAIFERFQQVDSSDARHKGGTGLGLPIARSIVRQHGGEMWVDSWWGEGSTFYFSLPVPAPAHTGGTEERPVVMVCDDEPGVRAFVREVLQREGYEPLVVASGEELLTAARNNPPAAILLDLTLPGLSGQQVVRALREQEETRRTPIVILTGTGGDSGMDVAEIIGWVEKPIDRTTLMNTVHWAVNRKMEHCHVLVVEDNEDLARVITEMIRDRGLSTCHARDGREAIELSRRMTYDLLMLDPGLPQVDGFGVVDWLRRHNRLRNVPLVVYSARELDDAARDRLRLGPTEFLVKTRISLDELAKRILARFVGDSASRQRANR